MVCYVQIQNGRFKTGMCPHLAKPGGCPKGDRCTYAHSEEERDRFRNMVKPAKPVKPRSGEQFSRPLGRNGSRSGDHGPTKAHTDTHPSLSTFQSGPSSAPEHFICYPGNLEQYTIECNHSLETLKGIPGNAYSSELVWSFSWKGHFHEGNIHCHDVIVIVMMSLS